MSASNACESFISSSYFFKYCIQNLIWLLKHGYDPFIYEGNCVVYASDGYYNMYELKHKCKQELKEEKKRKKELEKRMS